MTTKQELKTLKDLGWDDSGKGDNLVTHEDLKAEAVKDLKNKRVKHMSAIDYILVKFNITEEDLK